MTTRIQKITASDLSLAGATATREQSTGAGTDTNFSVAPANGGGQETHFFVTPANDPNSDSWESGGTWTVEIEIDTGDVEIVARVRVGRCDSSGTILQVGSFTSSQALDVSRTFSPVAPTWTGGEEACGNRQFIEIEFTNNAAHGGHSVSVGVGTTNNEIIDDITVNNGSCSAGASPYYYSIWRRLQAFVLDLLYPPERIGLCP